MANTSPNPQPLPPVQTKPYEKDFCLIIPTIHSNKPESINSPLDRRRFRAIVGGSLDCLYPSVGDLLNISYVLIVHNDALSNSSKLPLNVRASRLIGDKLIRGTVICCQQDLVKSMQGDREEDLF